MNTESTELDKAELIVVPTPIGNLSDLTLRVKQALTEADLIACEDTRTTGKLLKALDSKVPAISYHMHNEKARSEEVLRALDEGSRVALVSDAGMPGISDPGHVLITKAIQAGHRVTVLPGPTAFVTALVGSGLPTDRFTFIGFLEKNRNRRKAQLEALLNRQETLIFYEAPHRLRELLGLLLETLGDRRICLARELSKLYEEYERGLVSEVIAIYEAKEPRGEYVVILEGVTEEALRAAEEARLASMTIEDQVRGLMAAGASKMAAVKQVARERGLKKNDVYMRVTDLDGDIKGKP